MIEIIMFWAYVQGAQYKACVMEQNAVTQKQCFDVAPGASEYHFPNLKPFTDYVFTYIENGKESYPLLYRTGERDCRDGSAPCPECPQATPCPPPVICPPPAVPCPPCPQCPDPALVYHPNGQPYKDHWLACLATVCHDRETICALERDLFKCRKKTWKKCSRPADAQCKKIVGTQLP